MRRTRRRPLAFVYGITDGADLRYVGLIVGRLPAADTMTQALHAARLTLHGPRLVILAAAWSDEVEDYAARYVGQLRHRWPALVTRASADFDAESMEPLRAAAYALAAALGRQAAREWFAAHEARL